MAIKKELYQKEFRIVEIEDFELSYSIYLASRKDRRNLEGLSKIIKYFIKSGTTEFC